MNIAGFSESALLSGAGSPGVRCAPRAWSGGTGERIGRPAAFGINVRHVCGVKQNFPVDWHLEFRADGGHGRGTPGTGPRRT